MPIRTNSKTRDSRLFKSVPRFLERSLTTMVRMYSMFRPLKVFFLIGLVADLIGFNRQLLEMTLEKVRRIELEMGVLGDSEEDAAPKSEPAKFRARGKG